MTIRRVSRHDIVTDLDQARMAEPVDPEEPFEHWLPTYAPRLSVDENARSLARPLWGTARSEWTWCLAKEVVVRLPEAAELNEGASWVAGILWAAAIGAGMRQSDELWEHILDDITAMTGASREAAEWRWDLIKQVGLEQPAHPPIYRN